MFIFPIKPQGFNPLLFQCSKPPGFEHVLNRSDPVFNILQSLMIPIICNPLVKIF
jgi:hypothetical protein